MPKKVYRKSKNTFPKLATFILIIFFFSVIFYVYKNDIYAILGLKHTPTRREILNDKNVAKRNKRILLHYQDKVFGIDISEYQGRVDWENVNFMAESAPINFVFIRATVGDDRVDSAFKRNWELSDKRFIRGAYHYYRPNENSLEQAKLFIKTVRLEKGDFPPVLDIEKLPRNQSIDSLKVGLRRWLNKVEIHYGIKPIIYSGDKYYSDFLESEFSDYIFWIAHYDYFDTEINPKWQIWQFTEKSKVAGIRGNVDLNIFNGDIEDLKNLTVE